MNKKQKNELMNKALNARIEEDRRPKVKKKTMLSYWFHYGVAGGFALFVYCVK